jgi:hypothetical protein
MLQSLCLGGQGQELRQALQLVGKLEIPGRLNAVAPGLLVYINDQLTGWRFLVDTGAAFSILPHHSSDPATGQSLVGPSGSPIRCWGESAVKLKLADQHFTWSFLLADISTAILGIDFLRAHNLTVDPANCRLVQAGGRVFQTTAVTSGPRASVITGASPPTSRPAPRRKTDLRVASCRLECWQRCLFFLHTWSCCTSAGRLPFSHLCRPRVGSFGSGRCKTALRVVRCRLERRRATSSPPPAPAADQQAGISSAAVATSQRSAFPQSDLFLPANFPCFSSSFSSASRMW